MNGWSKLAAFVGVAAILAAITGGAGAAGTTTHAQASKSRIVAGGPMSAAALRRVALLRAADLSTRAGAVRGKWSCTKARRVLQIGTDNLYTCSPRYSGMAPNSCVIMQSGGGTATCTETSAGATQTCSITQASTTGANNALVTQALGQSGGGSGLQTATQNTSIAQTSTTGANSVTVRQALAQRLGRGSDLSDEGDNDADDFTPAVASAIVQAQNAHQNVDVMQTATGSGSNASSILRAQLQIERADHAPKIVQSQNTNPQSGTGPCAMLSAADDPTSNQCNAVQQTSTSGTNDSQVRQSYNQFQAASNCCAAQQGSQVQGVALQGGLEHRFKQSRSGLSTQSSNQIERQIQRRTLIGPAGIAHAQNGPTRKGTGIQDGNGGDMATQQQASTQLSTPGPNPNNTNLLSDQCTSSGNCTGTQTTNTASGATIALVTSCEPNCTTAPPGSLVVPAGGSASQTTSVNVPAKPPMADIELAIDTTGSMTAGIADAVSEANAIVTGVQASVPDSQFAVVQFKDSFDTPEYQVVQPMTASAGSVSTALGTLSASGGGDAPEAYNLVFQNSYTFDVAAIADGADIGHHTLTVFVP